MERIDAREFLQALRHRPLQTLTGRPNRILRVEADAVIVATDRSPAGKAVPIAWIQDALDRLMSEGAVEISVSSVGYRSAFVGAVLREVRGVSVAPGIVRLAAPRKYPLV